MAVMALLAAGCANGSGGEAGFVGKLAARSPEGVDGGSGTGGGEAAAALDPSQAAAVAAGAGGDAGTGSGGGRASGPQFTPRKVGRMGPGVTETEIRIGFQTTGDLSAGFAVVGASGDVPVETQIVEALVDWVNNNGGLAGRKVIPIIHETDPLGGTWGTQAAAACATLTEDNQVLIAGSSVVGGSDALYACMSAKGTPLIEQNLWLFDGKYYEKPGLLYQTGRISPDRWAKAYADGLAQAGYFDGKPKVGLIRFDAPVFARVSDNVLKPRMAQLGMAFTEEVAISSPESVAGFSSVSSQISNAILRLRSSGVTHVMFLENAGILPFLFMPAAESQGYRPRYGLSSNDIPATQEDQVPLVQLVGSVGVSWLPWSDVSFEQRVTPNPVSQLCMDIVKAAGIDSESGFYVMPPCDTIMFLRTVLDRASDLTADGIKAAVESLGPNYVSSMTYGTAFGPGRYDGGAKYRLLFFDTGCECYRITGPTRAVPT
jgi:hypothetical protein